MRPRKLSPVLSMVVVVMFLSACAQPTPTATPEPTTTPTYTITLPSDSQAEAIMDGTAKLSTQGPGVLAPEESKGGLQAICTMLRDKGKLINPESCDDGFRRERTSTYPMQGTFGQAGVLFQMVSLNKSVNDFLNPEKDWEGKELAVGGWLAGDGQRIVLLSRKISDPNSMSYKLVDAEGSSIEIGNWQLRSLQRLPTAPPDQQVIQEPYTFVAPSQACYSFTNYQACLNRTAPDFGGGANRDAITAAVEELQSAGQLPKNVQVDLDGAVASIIGSEAEQQCSKYETCLPSMISAPSELPPDTWPTSDSVPEIIPGISIASVTSPIKDFVTDEYGTTTELPKGSYRVDLLRIGDDKWLSRFVGIDKKAYYAAATPLAVSGAAFMGEGAAQYQSLLLSSKATLSSCRPNGTENCCSTLWGACKKTSKTDCPCRRKLWSWW